MRAALVFLALACVALGFAPGRAVRAARRLGARGRPGSPTHLGLHVPGTGSLPTVGIALVLVGLTVALALLRGSRRAAPAPTWASRTARRAGAQWTSAGFTKSLRLVLEFVLRPEREISSKTEGGVLQEVAYSGSVPHLIEDRLYRPVARVAFRAAVQARRLQTRQHRNLRRLPDRARHRPARLPCGWG